MSSNFREGYRGQQFKALYHTDPMIANTRNLEKESDEFIENECGYTVDYFRVVHDRGKRLEMRWGTFVDMSYDNGLVGYPQCDTFETLEDAKAFVEVKRKVVNNWYCGFGIRKTTYNKKTRQIGIDVIMECESVNATIVEEL